MSKEQIHYSGLVNRLTAVASRRGSPAPADAASEAVARTLAHPGAGPALRRYLDSTVPPLVEDGEWGPDNLHRWLYRVVAHVVSEQRRATRREVPVVDDRDAAVPDGSADSLVRLIDAESIARLHECLAALKPNVREALTMRLKECSYAEIATALGRPMNTVGIWIRRGCQELTKRFHASAALPTGTPPSRSGSRHE